MPEYNALLTRVTSDSGLAQDPVISTDGKLIAYASDRKDGTSLHASRATSDKQANNRYSVAAALGLTVQSAIRYQGQIRR